MLRVYNQEVWDVIIRDSELKGLICKITPKGKRVYMLYYRTKDGRERKPSLGVHGHINSYQARDLAIHCLSEIAKGNDPSLDKKLSKSSLTIKDLSERYLKEHASIYKKPLSIKRDIVLLKHHILPALGKIKVKTLTSKDITDLHYKMRDMPTSANRSVALLSKMLNLAEKWSICPNGSSLCKYVDKYPENKRNRFLSIPEIDKLSEALKEAEIYQIELPGAITAIRLLLLTGCRLSEILTIKWEYIDLANHRINFPDSKTGKKTIYISPFVIEVLNGIEKRKENQYVIIGAIPRKHLINLQKPWSRISKKAGLEGVRLHDLRHSFASIGAASGLSLPIIGALLGHTQAQTTARYAHLIGEPLKDAASLIGEKMKSIVG